MIPPGRVSATALSISLLCRLAERRQIALALGPGDVGVAADRSGRRAGRVDQRRVERRRLERERVGDRDLGLEPQPAEIGGEALQPLGRAVDRRDLRAGGGELGALAARRGAEIDDPRARRDADETRRDRRRGVLHPPFAVGVAGQLDDRRVGRKAHRAGRQRRFRRAAAPNRRGRA